MQADAHNHNHNTQTDNTTGVTRPNTSSNTSLTHIDTEEIVPKVVVDSVKKGTSGDVDNELSGKYHNFYPSIDLLT